jgi:hypothetical protein
MEIKKGFKFNRIIIIESLGNNDERTGKNLYDNLCGIFGEQTAEYYYVTNPDDFFGILDQIEHGTKNSGLMPIIHIEVHGNKEGICLEDRQAIIWNDIFRPFREINLAAGNNLMVVLAACYGLSLRNIFAEAGIERAPVYAVLGPDREVEPFEIKTFFKDFYKKLFDSLNPAEALNTSSYNITEKVFEMHDCISIFSAAYLKYVNNNVKNETDRKKRTAKIIEDFEKEKSVKIESYKRKEFENYIESRLLNGEYDFDRIKKRYFMINEFPENGSRFNIFYNDIENLSSILMSSG